MPQENVPQEACLALSDHTRSIDLEPLFMQIVEFSVAGGLEQFQSPGLHCMLLLLDVIAA